MAITFGIIPCVSLACAQVAYRPCAMAEIGHLLPDAWRDVPSSWQRVVAAWLPVDIVRTTR